MKVTPYVFYQLIGYTNYFAVFDSEGFPSVVSFKNFNKYPKGYTLKRYTSKGLFYWMVSSDSGDLFKITSKDLLSILGNATTGIPYTMERRKIRSKKEDINAGVCVKDRTTCPGLIQKSASSLFTDNLNVPLP